MPPAKRKKEPSTLRKTLLSKGPWPLVVIFALGMIAFTLIALLATSDTKTILFGANGLMMTILAAIVRSPLHEDDQDERDRPSDP